LLDGQILVEIFGKLGGISLKRVSICLDHLFYIQGSQVVLLLLFAMMTPFQELRAIFLQWTLAVAQYLTTDGI